jgi:hypothetical protein
MESKELREKIRRNAEKRRKKEAENPGCSWKTNLSVEQIEALKKEAELKKSPVSKQISKNTYLFEPGMIVNVLTVFIGK